MRTIKKLKTRVSFAGKLLVGLIIIAPILLGLSLSFMTAAEMASIPPHFIPHNPVTSTYQNVLKSLPLFRFMLNSFIVCGIVIVGQIITCSMAAYAFSFFKFKGQRALFLVVLSTMMIPVDAIIISNYLTISQLGLTDTYFALVMPYLTSAMGIFLMRQSFLTIPKEIKEASMLEGCGDLRFLLRMAMPISVPSVAALGVYVFIQTYNQFLWPLLVTNTQNMRTVQIGMDMLKNAEAVNYGVVLAGAMIILVPVIFVFVFGQRYLVKGMTAGGVKG
ncbi:carbohydrate ABC transporter permease [Ruminococcaceae bacterium OttesenSCG-928-A16]|nr:carbohydrate ABC transporter permease [Ruminococcaceae bacterium OttesenSCG-928-A16]